MSFCRVKIFLYNTNLCKQYIMAGKDIILVNITGPDQPGLTAKLTKVLADYNATVFDIGQADIHGDLALGILFQTPSELSGEVMKELLFKASELSVTIRFTPIDEQRYEEWVSGQGKNRYIITMVGPVITAKQISAVTTIVAQQQLNIDGIVRLTGRMPLKPTTGTPRACVELSVRGTPKDKKVMKESFVALSSELNFDISFQEESMYRRTRRLICFDMDSTLIQTEVIDELAKQADVGDQVKAITESAMRGEIDFAESFKQRIGLLKGLDESVLQKVADNLPITEGLDKLIRVLKKIGFKIAILSGGFTYFGERLKEKYNLDYMYANELEIKNGKLTGKHVGDIVDAKRKAELLKLIAQVERIDLRQTVAVGDGANDLLMIETAGLGIAYHAKPKVKQTAEQSLSSVGIDGILYFLGYKDSMLDEQLLNE